MELSTPKGESETKVNSIREGTHQCWRQVHNIAGAGVLGEPAGESLGLRGCEQSLLRAISSGEKQ